MQNHHLRGRLRSWRELEARRTARKQARAVYGRASEAAYLHARALSDPGDPALWAEYCACAQEAQRQAKPRILPPPQGKPALVPVLALAQSGLAPEALWAGPPPVYPPDRGDPDA